jgi:hypothetical protein
MEGADHARFELVFDDVTCNTFLYEVFTECKVALEDGHVWSLDFDDAGTAYVCNGLEDGTFWCDDLFEDVGEQDADGRVTVMTASGERVPLERYRQRFESMKVPLESIAAAKTYELKAFIFKQSNGGVWVYWGLSTLYTASLGTDVTMTPSRWYLSWWSWWSKGIAGLGFDPAPHLRRSAQTAFSNAPADESRFLEEPTMSTFALMNFLTRWSSSESKGGKRNPDDQKKWAGMHEAFIRQFCTKDEECVWAIALDTCVEVRLGLPIVGQDFVRVLLKSGQLDISPLLTCDVPHALQVPIPTKITVASKAET